MARVKNARGGPGDEDPRPPPRLPTNVKGKAMKKLTSKKQKYAYANTARAAVVAATAERAKRGGSESGICIGDQLSPAQRATVERIMVVHPGLSCLEDAVSL